MKDLALLKRITDIRDDLIESAYLPTAVPLPTPRPRVIHAALLGRIAVAAAACIVSCGVLIGIGVPVFQNWVIPALSGTDTETEEVTEPAEDGTQPDQEDNAEKIRLSVEVNPQVVKPGETVEITIAIVECHVEIVALFDPILTYGTIPVSREVLSYEPEHKYVSSSKPFHYTLTIPENAPAGEYDLSVECVGMDTTVTFEKVLTVELNDGAYVNPYVWITSEMGTIYPLMWEYGGRYVYTKDNMDADRSWSYSMMDGVGYMYSTSKAPTTLSTVVWSNNIKVYYADSVLDNGYVLVYDEEGKKIGYKKLNEISELESGIYYFAINGSYYGTDHTEEVLTAAKNIDEAWGDGLPKMQEEVYKALEEDPMALTDQTYCEHMLRVIIP